MGKGGFPIRPSIRCAACVTAFHLTRMHNGGCVHPVTFPAYESNTYGGFSIRNQKR
jgi:hypothetical protein